MERTTTRISTTLAWIGLGLGGLGCGTQEVQVAVVLPLSGEYQSYGEASRKGLELAYEEIQARGDVSPVIQLEVADSASDPAVASRVLEELFDGGAGVAIGGVTSVEAAAMLPVAEKRDRVILSPSATDPALTRGSRNFYSIAASDDMAASTAATFAARRLAVKSAVVVIDPAMSSDAVEESFRSSIEVQGGKLLDVVTAPADAAGTADAVARIRSLDADAVFLVGYEGKLAAFIRELKKSRFGGKILTTQALTPAIGRLGEDARGVLLTHTVMNGGVEGFSERYRAKYGEDPDVYAAEGYDALMVLAKALAGRPALASEVRKGLRDAVKSFSGVTGEIQFNEKGAVPKYPRIFSVADDLTLRDHGKFLDQEKERIEKERARIRQRLDDLREAAASPG